MSYMLVRCAEKKEEREKEKRGKERERMEQ